MKQLLVFFFLFFLALSVDLRPMELKQDDDRIHVTIKGAVEEEKTLELPRYASLQEALEETDVTEEADLNVLNPQMVLKDHDVIVIPTASPELPRISINTASLEELTLLPGIGKGTAERILAYRKDEGLFQNLEDLMNVKGIGPAKYEKLKDRICL